MMELLAFIEAEQKAKKRKVLSNQELQQCIAELEEENLKMKYEMALMKQRISKLEENKRVETALKDIPEVEFRKSNYNR